MNEERNCIEFLEEKCNEYLEHLICVGTKLAKKGKFDEEKFSKHFFPKRDFVLRKIKEQSFTTLSNKKENKKESPSKTSCLDSEIIKEMRAMCKELNQDFAKLMTKEDYDEENNDESAHKNSRTDSVTNESSNRFEKLPKKEKSTITKHQEEEDCGESHSIIQDLNYGELSKIFVQKSRIDVVRSKMEKPDFEDHLETIYVYRTRPSCHK